MISVLLVDDEPPMLESGKRYLEAKGHYNVSATLSPLTALGMLKTGHYDIIISDYNMPDMDGIGFLKQVRAAYPTLPFILYTSKSRSDIAGEAFDNEADFYLQRTGNPILVMEELTQKIQLIVERRRMQEALRASEEKFRAIFNSASDAIHIHEIGSDFTPGKFLDVNDVACRMLKMSREEILTQSPLDFAIEYHNPPLQEILQRFATKGNAIFETGHRRSDGIIVPVEINSHIINLQGKTVMLGIIRDITERKRAEDALRQANKQLNLLSSITRHDILNQLMVLKGYLELSHEVIDNPSTLIEYIKKEEKAANTIEHQIKFTKDYQELGVAAPEWQSVNANIIKAVAGLLIRDVYVEVDPKNPEVFADRLFEKVFYNLIDNALRYGGDQMKTIRVSSQEIENGLRIVFEDDGVGISEEDKKRLFTRGFGKNTGLGLFLSREILAITGITIAENGTLGKGARFEIIVPKGAWRMKRASE